MMKSVFWWRKPEYPEATTDLRQVTDETFHTHGLYPVWGLNYWATAVWSKVREICFKVYPIYRKGSPPPPNSHLKLGGSDLSRCRLPPVISHSTLATGVTIKGCVQNMVKLGGGSLSETFSWAQHRSSAQPIIIMLLWRQSPTIMCNHNVFVTLCHQDSFNCSPFICVASFIYSDIYRNLKQFIGDILILGGGGSLRDPPWAPVESRNARVLCSWGGGADPPPPYFEHWFRALSWLSDFISQQIGQNSESLANIQLVDIG